MSLRDSQATFHRQPSVKYIFLVLRFPHIFSFFDIPGVSIKFEEGSGLNRVTVSTRTLKESFFNHLNVGKKKLTSLSRFN